MSTGVITLVPLTPALLEAVLAGRRAESEQELGCVLPAIFPGESERRFLALRLQQMQEDDRFRTWCPHAVVLDGEMIGHAGYHGPPGINAARNPAAVEFGYTIFPAYRGRGHATEVVRMLMDEADTRGVQHFVLSVSPTNEPSLAIVRKLGFVQTGEQMDDEDGLEHVFELDRTYVAEIDRR